MPLREGTPVTLNANGLIREPLSGEQVLANIRKFQSEFYPPWVSAPIPGYFEKVLASQMSTMDMSYERAIKDTFLYKSEDFFGSYTKEGFGEHWEMLLDKHFRQQCMNRIAEILDESV